MRSPSIASSIEKTRRAAGFVIRTTWRRIGREFVLILSTSRVEKARLGLLARPHFPAEKETQIWVCKADFALVFVPINSRLCAAFHRDCSQVFQSRCDFMFLGHHVGQKRVQLGSQFFVGN